MILRMEKCIHPVEGILLFLEFLHCPCGYIGKINGRAVNHLFLSTPFGNGDLIIGDGIRDPFFHFIHRHPGTVLSIDIGAREKPVLIIYAYGQISRSHDQ